MVAEVYQDKDGALLAKRCKIRTTGFLVWIVPMVPIGEKDCVVEKVGPPPAPKA